MTIGAMPIQRKTSPPVNSAAPLPGTAEDKARRDTQRFRRRILEGRWQSDLDRKVTSFWDPRVAAQITMRDMSKNLGGRVSTEVATLYEREPLVTLADPDDAALEVMGHTLAEAGLWQLQQGTNRLAYGIRESFLRADAVRPPGQDTATVAYRLVPPDMVQAYASPDTPDEPDLLFEARLRRYAGKQCWTWDVVDLRDLDAPKYRIFLADSAGEDPDTVMHDATEITEDVLGESMRALGADAPPGNWLWWADGVPIWPYPIYHAQRTGKLFDELRFIEMFHATVMVGAYYSFWGMAVRDGSYPIRTLYGSVKGVGVRGDDVTTRRTATIAPGVVLELDSPDGGISSPQIDQWGPAIDPERLQMAISEYEKRAMIDAGLSPSDVDKRGGPESGYSKTVSRESVRRVARAMSVPFRRADEHVLRLTAGLLNRWAGESLPVEGWRVEYRGTPKPPEQVRAELEQWRADYDLGLVSLVDLVMRRNPQIRDREEAKQFLRDRERERREFVAESN